MTPRTFVILPKLSSSHASHFLPAQNGLASDETSAHTGMFDAKTNDGYYELGLMTAQLLRDVIISIRTVREAAKPKSNRLSVPEPPSPTPKKEVKKPVEQEPDVMPEKEEILRKSDLSVKEEAANPTEDNTLNETESHHVNETSAGA